MERPVRYEICRREKSLKMKGPFWRRRRADYARPWALLESGNPIGFYLTEEDAKAAIPVEIPAEFQAP